MTDTQRKPKIATVWLDGCSGCHMSLLDMDERLIHLASAVELVSSPLVDEKNFPPDVDITLVEGAVATAEDVHRAKLLRANSRIVVAMGDCAVTGNVPAMRNMFDKREVLARAYEENATWPAKLEERRAHRPRKHLPELEDKVRPLHAIIDVDLFMPGCPPRADAIHFVLGELLAGRKVEPSTFTRFGL